MSSALILHLPASIREKTRWLRYQYHTDRDFAGRVDEAALALQCKEGYSEEVSHEVALFGEAFLWNGKCLNPDEMVVRITVQDSTPTYEHCGEVIGDVRHIFQKAHPYDTRGTSGFLCEMPSSSLEF